MVKSVQCLSPASPVGAVPPLALVLVWAQGPDPKKKKKAGKIHIGMNCYILKF